MSRVSLSLLAKLRRFLFPRRVSSCGNGPFSDGRKVHRSHLRRSCPPSRSSSANNVRWKSRSSPPRRRKSRATAMGRSSKHDTLPISAIREQATAHGRRVWLDRDTPTWDPGTSYRLIASLSALRSPRAWSRVVLSSMNFRRRQRSSPGRFAASLSKLHVCIPA